MYLLLLLMFWGSSEILFHPKVLKIFSYIIFEKVCSFTFHISICNPFEIDFYMQCKWESSFIFEY